MIKTGILGTSETANFYATTLKNSDSFELTGCFSPDYDKAKTFATNFGQIAYPTVEALFKYADVLIITDFSPDFLNITTKALKNFKHVLITNPFLAGLDEIQYLRKLSEESRVIFQIAGGFNYYPYISGFLNKKSYFAELKHSCNCEPGLCNNTRYLEVLLQDSAVILALMRGTAKRISINSWDCKGLNPDLLSARIELDNGNIANLLITQGEKENKLNLELYSNDGISRTSIVFTQDNQDKILEDSISLELAHFYTRIHNPFSNSNQHDMIFQALEIAHTIRAKVIRHYAVNAQN